MATTWLQVLLATSINRDERSLPCGMATGYLRRPGNPCPPLHTQMGVSTPIFRSYLVENSEGQLLTRAETLSQRKKKN